MPTTQASPSPSSVDRKQPDLPESGALPEDPFDEVMPEAPPAPEAGPEKVAEKEPTESDIVAGEKKPKPAAPLPKSKAAPAPAPAREKSKMQQDIEDILSADLVELYQQMDAEKQQEFKVKGEETASKIAELVGSAKATAKKVVSLIIDWLKIIPGVNKFFLEQEAKIKTDKILDLAQKDQENKISQK